MTLFFLERYPKNFQSISEVDVHGQDELIGDPANDGIPRTDKKHTLAGKQITHRDGG